MVLGAFILSWELWSVESDKQLDLHAYKATKKYFFKLQSKELVYKRL